MRIPITLDEILYRRKYWSYFEGLSYRKVHCASCGNELEARNAHSHPIFNVLQCTACREKYADIDFSSKKFVCFMCGNSSAHTCSNENCSLEFCKACISRNAKQCLLNAVHGDWICFGCNIQPLWELRGVCAAVVMAHPFYNCRPSGINISTSTQKENNVSLEKKSNVESTLRKRKRQNSDSSDSDSEPKGVEGEYHFRITDALEDSETSLLKFITKEKQKSEKKGMNASEIKIQIKKVFGSLKIEIAERSKKLGRVYKTWRKKQVGSFYALKKKKPLISEINDTFRNSIKVTPRIPVADEKNLDNSDDSEDFGYSDSEDSNDEASETEAEFEKNLKAVEMEIEANSGKKSRICEEISSKDLDENSRDSGKVSPRNSCKSPSQIIVNSAETDEENNGNRSFDFERSDSDAEKEETYQNNSKIVDFELTNVETLQAEKNPDSEMINDFGSKEIEEEIAMVGVSTEKIPEDSELQKANSEKTAEGKLEVFLDDLGLNEKENSEANRQKNQEIENLLSKNSEKVDSVLIREEAPGEDSVPEVTKDKISEVEDFSPIEKNPEANLITNLEAGIDGNSELILGEIDSVLGEIDSVVEDEDSGSFKEGEKVLGVEKNKKSESQVEKSPKESNKPEICRIIEHDFESETGSFLGNEKEISLSMDVDIIPELEITEKTNPEPKETQKSPRVADLDPSNTDQNSELILEKIESESRKKTLNLLTLAKLKMICDSSSDPESVPVSKKRSKSSERLFPKKYHKFHSLSQGLNNSGTRKKKFRKFSHYGKIYSKLEKDENSKAKENLLKSSSDSDSTESSEISSSENEARKCKKLRISDNKLKSCGFREKRLKTSERNFRRLISLKKKSKIHSNSSNEDMSVNEFHKRLFRDESSLENEEAFINHLRRIGNETANVESMDPLMSMKYFEKKIRTNEELLIEAEKSAKEQLLNSSISDSDDAMVLNKEYDKSRSTKKSTKNGGNKFEAEVSLKDKTNEDVVLISEDETDLVTDDEVSDLLTDDKNSSESKEDEISKTKSKVEIYGFSTQGSDSESESEKLKVFHKKLNEENTQKASEEETKRLKILKERRIRRMILSDSDNQLSDGEDLIVKKKKSKFNLKHFLKKRKSKKNKKRKRKNVVIDEIARVNSNLLGSVGRKNIRKVLTDRELDAETRRADRAEKERVKRINERQKLFEEKQKTDKKIDKLVLDIDENTKEELITVHKDLVKHLKPHQAQGIKFMWDSCFESLERIKTSSGSGCILAHCMGLGKTFQVVSLSHTLLTHKQTGINTILVVVPLCTANNWFSEYQMWLRDVNHGKDFPIYEMKRYKINKERKFLLETWKKTGGVLIIGYEMFRNLTKEDSRTIDPNSRKVMINCLVDPGPDMIVCDEGHLLKNEASAICMAIKKVKTSRRITLTGTPLQNNLKEYHCMVQFVKPNLLGSRTEFMNRFFNPIENGQFEDSDIADVRLMKKRAYLLHDILKGCVQRFDYKILTPFLPPKQEYVIFVRLSAIQIKIYQYFLDHFVSEIGRTLFADFQCFQRIMTHPRVVQMYSESEEKKQKRKVEKRKELPKKIPKLLGDEDFKFDEYGRESTNGGRMSGNLNWWKKFISDSDLQDMKISYKLQLLFGILNECEKNGEKLLVFSKAIFILDVIEEFLGKINKATKQRIPNQNLGGQEGQWKLGRDYFRLDGQANIDRRSSWCDQFNRPSNTRARLFLISTKAGGLGINLTGANRVIIFDASWNPSHDLQAIFRIYRFGQRKPCYVYRFIALGTMEERIYNRQVTKLSLACRVIDEQQIERHYKKKDIAELYRFEPKPENPREGLLNPPNDRLLAKIFLKYGDLVENYHELDSLLENKEDEVLNDEDRKRAWLEYEDEKSGKKILLQLKQEINDSYFDEMFNSTMNETTNDFSRIPSPVASVSQISPIHNSGFNSPISHYSDAEDVISKDSDSISICSAATTKVPYLGKKSAP